MSYFPSVIEPSITGDRAYDVLSRLLKDRIIVVGEIDDDSSTSIVSQLLFLDCLSQEPIYMYINSPGGIITSGLAIYDIMKNVKSRIYTICIGQAASMGAFLLSAGDHRIALPNSRIMIHQPLGGARGQASDIEIQAKEILYLKNKLNQMFADQSKGKMSKKAVEKYTDRDNFLTPEEALNLGIIDEIKYPKPKD